MQIDGELQTHLNTGATTLARCWLVERPDGVSFGFTDHDRTLAYDGHVFRADTGVNAHAVQQGTGLSVDNTEALGALSDAAVTEADILAGRFDDAQVTCWIVNWADVAQRTVLFRGYFGELERSGGRFRAELRGLTDRLNQPVGRVFQKTCDALLGDGRCRFDTATLGYTAKETALGFTELNKVHLPALHGFEPGWFQRGVLTVLEGALVGVTRAIRTDLSTSTGREITLWQALPSAPGTEVQLGLLAGCDKRFETCRLKFNNALNFQGFPDIPGEDWATSVPATSPINDGASRR